ncbi:hypothetical protein CAAN1_16S03422 [[Candida] anglica]|uniref:Uncharacterized protein n=1 Tax=[Candida] anglica TaxID=148631 RepID=A0ABP0EEJ5_9ASCO
MSKTTKYILGGLTLVGASLYVYEQQVNQVALKRKEQHQGVLSSFGSNSKDQTDLRAVGAEKGYKIGESLENLKQKANKQAESYDIPERVNSTLSTIEQKRSELAAAVAEKAEDVSKFAAEHADKHDSQSQYLHDEAHKNDPGFFKKLLNKTSDKVDEAEHSIVSGKNQLVHGVDQSLDDGKNFLLKLGDKYIDAVNHAGLGAEGAVAEAKDSADEASARAKSKLDTKAQELEAEKNSWFRWASNRREEAKAKCKERSEKRGWFGRKSSADEARDTAAANYEKAKKDLDTLRANAVSGGKSWLSWGKAQTEDLNEQTKAQLAEAEKQVNQSLAALKGYGQDLIDSIDKKFPAERSLTEEELAQRSYNSLRGWGDSAADFAEDELRTIDSYSRKHPHQANWADDVFNKSEKLSKYAYERAQQKYNELTKEVEKSQKKAQGWFSSQSKELEKTQDDVSAEVNRQLDDAKVQLEKAKYNFSNWASKSGSQLADATEDAIDATKRGLKVGHEHAQRGLSQTQEWVNEKK